jgi:hypothetical protein
MNLETVEKALLAGDVAAMGLIGIELAAPNALVVAHGNRKTVHAVNGFRVQVLPRLSQDREQGEKQIPDAMQPPIEPTLAQHGGNHAIAFQILPSGFKIASKENNRGNRRCHHLCIGHLTLGIFRMMQRLEQIVTQAINGYNTVVHGSLQWLGFGHH